MEVLTGGLGKPILVLPLNLNQGVGVAGVRVEAVKGHKMIEGLFRVTTYAWSTDNSIDETVCWHMPNFTPHKMQVVGIDSYVTHKAAYTVNFVTLEGKGAGLILLPFDSKLDNAAIAVSVRVGKDIYLADGD